METVGGTTSTKRGAELRVGRSDESPPIERGQRSEKADRYAGLDAGATRGRNFPPEVILNSFARKVELSTTKIDDLVAPAYTLEALSRLEKLIRQRKRVMEDWSFATRGGEADGVTAIFHGPEGMGKTLAARVLAKRLDKPLYSVDLARIQGRSPAQTLANLDRLLDAAAHADSVLLFENADVLLQARGYGKDRASDENYLIASFLLNKLKQQHGAVILESETNLDNSAILNANMKLEFSYPDERLRAEIWRRVFPAGTPVSKEISLDALGLLNMNGGSIANVARNAAALAAAKEQPISLDDVRAAAFDEKAKLGQIISNGVESQVLNGTRR